MSIASRRVSDLVQLFQAASELRGGKQVVGKRAQRWQPKSK